MIECPNHEDAYQIGYDQGAANGYITGVRDAVEYIRDELGIDLTDSNVLLDMAGGDFDGD